MNWFKLVRIIFFSFFTLYFSMALAFRGACHVITWAEMVELSSSKDIFKKQSLDIDMTKLTENIERLWNLKIEIMPEQSFKIDNNFKATEEYRAFMKGRDDSIDYIVSMKSTNDGISYCNYIAGSRCTITVNYQPFWHLTPDAHFQYIKFDCASDIIYFKYPKTKKKTP